MSMSKSNNGFTLLELAVVLVIAGVLASVAIVQYSHFFEKARADEAKQKLWEIRIAWGQYRVNYRDPQITMSDLKLDPDVFPAGCIRDAQFKYKLNSTHAAATRCRASGYTITLDLANSTWGGTSGHY